MTEVKRGDSAEVVLNNLYQQTQMESVFGINMVALVDGRPQTLNLKQMLGAFIRHRREVITRRTKIQLVIFVVITLLGCTFVGARYAQLDRFFYDDSYTVTAHFADSGGVFAGAEVTYRGVSVGRVNKLVLTDEAGGNATVTIADVLQSNGVIHVVDTVLMPN